jgi:hypothetical protein
MPATAPTPMLHPLLLPWTDFGLRALESIVSSSQTMGEQVDRATRATASEPAAEGGAATLLAVSRLQWMAFEWMTQSWQQWFNTMAAFSPVQGEASAPQGHALAGAGTRRRSGGRRAPPKAAARRRGSRSKPQ